MIGILPDPIFLCIVQDHRKPPNGPEMSVVSRPIQWVVCQHPDCFPGQSDAENYSASSCRISQSVEVPACDSQSMGGGMALEPMVVESIRGCRPTKKSDSQGSETPLHLPLGKPVSGDQSLG